MNGRASHGHCWKMSFFGSQSFHHRMGSNRHTCLLPHHHHPGSLTASRLQRQCRPLTGLLPALHMSSATAHLAAAAVSVVQVSCFLRYQHFATLRLTRQQVVLELHAGRPHVQAQNKCDVEFVPGAGTRERSVTCIESATKLPVPLIMCNATPDVFKALQGEPAAQRVHIMHGNLNAPCINACIPAAACKHVAHIQHTTGTRWRLYEPSSRPLKWPPCPTSLNTAVREHLVQLKYQHI